MTTEQTVEEATIKVYIYGYFLNGSFIKMHSVEGLEKIRSTLFLSDFVSDMKYKTDVKYALCMKPRSKMKDTVAWYNNKTQNWSFKPHQDSDTEGLDAVRFAYRVARLDNAIAESLEENAEILSGEIADEGFVDFEEATNDHLLAEKEADMVRQHHLLMEDPEEEIAAGEPDDVLDDIIAGYHSCSDPLDNADLMCLQDITGLIEKELFDPSSDLEVEDFMHPYLDSIHDMKTMFMRTSGMTGGDVDDITKVLSELTEHIESNPVGLKDEHVYLASLKYALTNLIMTTMLYKLRLHSFVRDHQ